MSRRARRSYLSLMSYRLLYLVPKNWISRLIGSAVERRWPFGLHRRIRDTFIRRFRVDVSEAEKPIHHYETLGEFFVRKLRPGTRPLGASPLVSPVDGTLTERGTLEAPDLYLTQVKGVRYSLESLLAGWDATPYAGGAFLTVYLAPWNYHRIHAPADVRILRARHVAGMLWPVNRWSTHNISGLFVRNDRILIEMESGPGRMVLALVGATNVGRITLEFCGLRGNETCPSGVRDFSPGGDLHLPKGADLACFEMGSTIVLVLDAYWAARLKPELLSGRDPVPVRFGMDLAAPAPSP